MKIRLICLLLCVFTILPILTACGQSGDGGTSAGSTTGEQQAPAEIVSWVTYSYDRLRTDVDAPENRKTEHTLYMAKGETEGFQVAFRSSERQNRLVFSQVSEDVDGITVSMYAMEKQHTVKRKDYTDSVIPYTGKRLLMLADTTLSILVEFTTSRDVTAGEYTYTFEMRDGDDNTVGTYTAKVKVWDIPLPEKLTFETSMGIRRIEIERLHGTITDELYVQYYDMLLAHNVSAYDLPYDILDPRADAYMSDPRVTSFIVPHNKTDAQLKAYYNKLKGNSEWLAKAYFYPIDEPDKINKLNNLKSLCQKLKQLCPDIRITSPFYNDIEVSAGRDTVDFMEDIITLWCPKLALWNDDYAYRKLSYKPESFASRMAAKQKAKQKVWTYVCNAPTGKYVTLFVDTKGVNQRTMFWQIFQRDIDGFLYWSTNAWTYNNKAIDPWSNLLNGCADENSVPVAGEGILFYPGNKVALHGPVASVRLKIVRDGIDDIELFYIAEQHLGREWLDAKLAQATTEVTNVLLDNDGFAALRAEIGNALEDAIKKGE